MGSLSASHPILLTALTALPAVVALLRAWIRHRTAVRVEEEHTKRVRLAVEGSAREQRADVVWASAGLEAASRRAQYQLRRRSARRSVRSP